MLINVFLSAALGETRQRVRICTLTHYAWRYIWFLTGEQWVFQECDLRIIYNSSSRDPAPMYKIAWESPQLVGSNFKYSNPKYHPDIFFWVKRNKMTIERSYMFQTTLQGTNIFLPKSLLKMIFPKVGYVIVFWRAPSLKLTAKASENWWLVQTILQIVGFREGTCFILAPRSLTARPWKMMVGRRSFPIGSHVTTSGGYGIWYIFYLGGVPPPALLKPMAAEVMELLLPSQQKGNMT